MSIHPDAGDSVAHEIGHALINLADEYGQDDRGEDADEPVEGTVKEGPNGPIYTASLKPEQLRIGTRLLRFVVRDNTKLTESWPTTVKTHAPCTKQWMITVRPTLPRLPFLGNGD